MTISGSGLQDSGLDRALQVALKAELDTRLESGELWTGELAQFPDPVPRVKLVRRPWQREIDERRQPPATRSPGSGKSPKAPEERIVASEDEELVPASGPAELDRCIPGVPPRTPTEYDEALARNFPDQSDPKKAAKQAYMRWRPERVGIVMVHGIGPQLAGQTLLDWTRPIIELLKDAPKADGRLEAPPASARDIKDPVAKANIDFSGETFPVIQVRIPRRKDVADDDPRGQERTWVFTEAWWAQEVRAPSLSTMISWLGEQGGVGRIVQGIQENTLGPGLGAFIGRISLQPIVSVVTSFFLLLFVLLLGLARIIPFGPLRDAVVLRLAASFLTDWFGGARTLLRDAGQSANVRNRLVMTIKALRAYGCRDVVIVAHSGGTMVSLMTLTDPAFPNLRVQKLITIGEALNLGWRLNAEDPDADPPSPPIGDRMAADMGKLQPDLQWRDFWATHDPAPSGRPQLPQNYGPIVFPRFTAERVYNRMAILDDHGGYWDNDEHFVMPLIREIDVPTGDRGASRFYGDAEESYVRSRRKERVGLLALWRRALLSLPTVAILAAATVSAPGFVAIAGAFALQVFGLIPGNELVADVADSIVRFFRELSLENVPLIPEAFQVPSLLVPLQTLGTWALEAILIVLLLFALLPGRVDRLWINAQRGSRPRFILLALDFAVGVGVFAMVATAFALLSRAEQVQILQAISLGSVLFLLLVGAIVGLVGWVGPKARKWLGPKVPSAPAWVPRWMQIHDRPARAARNTGIAVSAIALGAILVAILVIVLGVALVIIDGSEGHAEAQKFVIGAIAILFVFSLIGRLGNWRWNVWDVRERRKLRQKPTKPPPRLWPYLMGSFLTVIVFAATSVVALGADGSTWLGVNRDTWLVGIAIAIVLVVIISLAKDIVDNDIAVETSASTGPGQPAAVTVDKPPPGPGS
jgi:pimeloyl-ACP methyl ester carboxylesterase